MDLLRFVLILVGNSAPETLVFMPLRAALHARARTHTHPSMEKPPEAEDTKEEEEGEKDPEKEPQEEKAPEGEETKDKDEPLPQDKEDKDTWAEVMKRGKRKRQDAEKAHDPLSHPLQPPCALHSSFLSPP